MSCVCDRAVMSCVCVHAVMSCVCAVLCLCSSSDVLCLCSFSAVLCSCHRWASASGHPAQEVCRSHHLQGPLPVCCPQRGRALLRGRGSHRGQPLSEGQWNVKAQRRFSSFLILSKTCYKGHYSIISLLPKGPVVIRATILFYHLLAVSDCHGRVCEMITSNTGYSSCVDEIVISLCWFVCVCVVYVYVCVHQ